MKSIIKMNILGWNSWIEGNILAPSEDILLPGSTSGVSSILGDDSTGFRKSAHSLEKLFSIPAYYSCVKEQKYDNVIPLKHGHFVSYFLGDFFLSTFSSEYF